MTVTVFLAILGGIATAAAAIKGVPVVYNALKKTGKFFEALEDISGIERLESNQEELKSSLSTINSTLERVEKENKEFGNIRNLALDFSSTITAVSENAVELTVTAFKAHVNHCDVPSFVISTSHDKVGKFIWANESWYKLHGIGYIEASNGQFWDSVSEEDRVRVKAASDMAAESRIEFKVSYTVINQQTQLKTKVTANSWPLIPYSAEPDARIIYLGGIAIH